MDEPILRGLPETFDVGRYHSWVVDRNDFPESELEVTAVDPSGQIMGLRHRTHRVYGVQFHPESVLTQHGASIIKNVVLL
jgi:anthranilate synthase component 2